MLQLETAWELLIQYTHFTEDEGILQEYAKVVSGLRGNSWLVPQWELTARTLDFDARIPPITNYFLKFLAYLWVRSSPKYAIYYTWKWLLVAACYRNST